MTTQQMYVPLPPDIETQFRETFLHELKTETLDQLAEASVEILTDWRKHPTRSMRRITRYLSTIHSKAELSDMLKQHMTTILGSSAPAESSSDVEIDGGQAGAGAALAVLGIAIAVWLIGWAITGKCDWYMGAYSP